MVRLRALICGLVLIGGVAMAPPATSQLVFEPLSVRIMTYLRPAPDSVVLVWPMLRQGDPEVPPGLVASPAANTDVFSRMLELAGIEPCLTDPMALGGRRGVLELIPDFLVLNGGRRATLGFFLQAAQGLDSPGVLMPFGLEPGLLLNSFPGDPSAAGRRFIHVLPGPEYFVLMSYDLVDATPAGRSACAFEVFLFGPVTRPGPGETLAPFAPLVEGVAVNPEGNVLSGVPEHMARVTNFISDVEDPLVSSGVNRRDHGCLVCHDIGVESLPQSTFPFPWLGGLPEGLGFYPWEP